MMFSVTLVSCGTGDDKGINTSTSGTSVIITTSDDGEGTKDPEKNEGKFKVDGDLSDWQDIKSISLVGNTEETKEKSVTFYGVTTSEGLYIACEVRHDIYSFEKTDWWENSNLEFFISSGRDHQYYVYADGMGNDCRYSSNIDSAKMVTEELTDKGTAYHTVVEAFVSIDNIPGKSIPESGLNVGVAWKTVGDKITGGQANNGGEDEYWVPAGSWPDNDDQAVVKEDGIYLKAEVNGDNAGNGENNDAGNGENNTDTGNGTDKDNGAKGDNSEGGDMTGVTDVENL